MRANYCIAAAQRPVRRRVKIPNFASSVSGRLDRSDFCFHASARLLAVGHRAHTRPPRTCARSPNRSLASPSNLRRKRSSGRRLGRHRLQARQRAASTSNASRTAGTNSSELSSASASAAAQRRDSSSPGRASTCPNRRTLTCAFPGCREPLFTAGLEGPKRSLNSRSRTFVRAARVGPGGIRTYARRESSSRKSDPALRPARGRDRSRRECG